MSTTPAQTTATKPVSKVLRIGIVQEGKIIQERLMKIGELVTVGTGSKNTFEIGGEGAPERLELFVPKAGAYVMTMTAQMEGKLSLPTGVKNLEELLSSGQAAKRGDLYTYPIGEEVKGKVVVGNTTVLFQFVPAPPEPVRMVTVADYRPKWFDQDDPLFMGLMLFNSIVAGIFMIWIKLTPMPEVDEMAQIEAVTDMIVDVIELPPPVLEEQPEDVGKTETKKAESKSSKAENQPKAASNNPQASAVQKSVLLQAIGAGGVGLGVVQDLIGDDAASMASLNSALSGASGAEMATADAVGAYKEGSGGGGGPADADVKVGSVGGGGTGGVQTGTGAVAIKARVADGGSDVDVEEGDAGNIQSVVRKSEGRIRNCTETALKANPTLKGRISVTWTITAGKVTGASLASNATGDAALGECVVRAVRGFRFDAGVTGTVDQYTWIVSAQ